MSAADAAWRTAPGRHNIWEIVVHAAYWKYAVWRRLTGERRGSFALKGSNWFSRPQAQAQTDEAWRADIALLDRTHKSLRQAVKHMSTRDLDRKPRPGGLTNFAVISGIIAHDLYHAGQIQLLKRLRVDP